VKITEVEPIGLSLRRERSVADGTQDALLIRIHTDEGLSGVGEADTSPLIGKAVIDAPVSGDKCQGLRHVLLGEDPLNRELLWSKMFYRSYKYGRMGAALNVISGIDMALWDLQGKALGKPVSQLLGGPLRSEVAAYQSVLFPEDPSNLDEVRGHAERCLKEGFTAIKYGWGSFGYDSDRDVAMVAAARKVIGPRTALMIDVGMRWDAQTGIQRLERLREFDPYWIEEPCYADDYETYRAIAKAAPFTRIVGGEQEYNRWGFRRLIEWGGVKGIQPDLARNGGITETRKVAAIAEAHGVPVFLHGWSTNVLLAANLQFIASTPNAQWLEYTTQDSPLRWELTLEQLPLVHGNVRVPQGPGLGVTLNEELVKRYRIF